MKKTVIGVDIDPLKVLQESGANSAEMAQAMIMVQEDLLGAMQLAQLSDEAVLAVMRCVRSMFHGGPVDDLVFDRLAYSIKDLQETMPDDLEDALTMYRPEIVEEVKRRAAAL